MKIPAPATWATAAPATTRSSTPIPARRGLDARDLSGAATVSVSATGNTSGLVPDGDRD
jgi:hypothetical protein